MVGCSAPAACACPAPKQKIIRGKIFLYFCADEVPGYRAISCIEEMPLGNREKMGAYITSRSDLTAEEVGQVLKFFGG